MNRLWLMFNNEIRKALPFHSHIWQTCLEEEFASFNAIDPNDVGTDLNAAN
jgi:hypothetical protein